MTVIISNKVDSQEPWDEFMLRAEALGANLTDSKYWPYPIQGGVRARYSQRCVDTVTGLWTPWATYYQDIYGNEYPGAGFDSATYKIESITHDREQG